MSELTRFNDQENAYRPASSAEKDIDASTARIPRSDKLALSVSRRFHRVPLAGKSHNSENPLKRPRLERAATSLHLGSHKKPRLEKSHSLLALPDTPFSYSPSPSSSSPSSSSSALSSSALAFPPAIRYTDRLALAAASAARPPALVEKHRVTDNLLKPRPRVSHPPLPPNSLASSLSDRTALLHAHHLLPPVLASFPDPIKRLALDPHRAHALRLLELVNYEIEAAPPPPPLVRPLDTLDADLSASLHLSKASPPSTSLQLVDAQLDESMPLPHVQDGPVVGSDLGLSAAELLDLLD